MIPVFCKLRSISLLAAIVMTAPLLIDGAAAADLKSVDAVLKRDQLDRAATLMAPILQKDADDHVVWEVMGQIEWRRGNTNKAAEYFSKALALDAKSAVALAGQALVALDRKDAATAESMARKAIDQDKNEWLARYAMGRVLLLKGDKNGAFEFIEKGKKRKGRAEDADLFESAMGLLALADHDSDAAEISFIKARGMAQNTVEHIMNLADHYEATEQWGNAVNLFKALGPALETSPKLAYRLGRGYENQQRYQDAFKQYQVAVSIDSTFAPALGAMGHLLLLDKRRTAQAAGYLNKAVVLEPSYQIRLDLGVALVRLRRSKEAIPHLKMALEEKDDPRTRAVLARAYVNTKEHVDEGLAMFETDIDVKLEASTEALVDVGKAYTRKKDYRAARVWLELALEKDSESVEAIYRIGYLDLLSEDYPAAITAFEVKLKADPRSASAWSRMGIAQQHNGNLPEAIKAYRKAAELRPKSARLWNQLAGALSASGNYTDAIIAYSRALQASPKSKQALRGRGFTYLVQEKYALCIKDLQVAAQVDPNHVDTMVYLGQARLNSGQFPEAKAAFEKAIELDPSNADALEGLDLISSRGH